ncbi:MAG: hypothetical protein V1809_08060 [Planctomycetota bacterium]
MLMRLDLATAETASKGRAGHAGIFPRMRPAADAPEVVRVLADMIRPMTREERDYFLQAKIGNRGGRTC